MNKKILFSPVGGTDPVSQINCRDGSLLHICRFEKPDKVVLYLSKEMVDHEQKDQRYSYCLGKLMELQNRKFEVEMICRQELVDVQDFDFFYGEFSGIINKIMDGMDESDTLILNISSGTPAMKSALAVLKTISEISCRLIQVPTPVKSQNIHDNRKYNPVAVWDSNKDNELGAENRCVDVEIPSLAVKKKEEVIKMHVRAYDYHAALQVARTMPAKITSRYIAMLEMASLRYNFDLNEFKVMSKKNNYRPPIEAGNLFKRFEYALILQVKLEKKEYADFIRALTPLIVDLFEQALEKNCGIAVDEYSYYRERKDGIKIRNWDRKKLELNGEKVLKALDDHYINGFTYGVIYSDHLKVLIECFSKDENLKNLTESLRNVESQVRNIAAHDMDSFDDVKIKSLTGMSANKIMQLIRSYFAYLGYNISKEAWNSYNEMNELIIESI